MDDQIQSTLIKLISCFIVLFFGLHKGYGQGALYPEKIPVDLKNIQVNLNILEPSFSFEKKVSDNQSFTMAAGITMLTDLDSEYETDFLYSVNPFIEGSFQHYYKRKWVNEQLKSNSGNYIGVSAGYYFDSVADNSDFGTTEQSNSFFVGPVWGIQRNYNSGIHLKLSLGLGIGFGEKSEVFFTSAGGFEFGFVIN